MSHPAAVTCLHPPTHPPVPPQDREANLKDWTSRCERRASELEAQAGALAAKERELTAAALALNDKRQIVEDAERRVAQVGVVGPQSRGGAPPVSCKRLTTDNITVAEVC